MPIGGRGFDAGFETVGGGVANPEVLEHINEKANSANWTQQTRVLNPRTGQVTSGEEFKAYCEKQKEEEAQRVGRIATLTAMANTTQRPHLHNGYASMVA